MTRTRSRLTALFVAALATILLACSSDEPSNRVSPDAPTVAPTSTPAATATVIPSPTPTPVPAPAAPSGARIVEIDRQLSQTIGTRPPGSPQERTAGDYLAGLLRGFGYEVSFQDFPVTDDSTRDSMLVVRNPDAQTVLSVPFQRTIAGEVTGPLVSAGLGAPADFPASARGAIVLVERGELLFQDKVRNAQAAGAKGVIIFNNEPGAFFGSLNDESSIPAASISQSEGQKLRAALGRSSAEATLTVGALSETGSRNVVAKTAGRDCEIVVGGHYDSVRQAPGANDNGSGASTVVEIAAVMSSRNAGNICYVLFGAEEVGLYGSKAYVNGLDAGARSKLKAMLNFDMVGVGEEGWQLIGSAALQARMQEIATSMGITTTRSSLAGTNASSDHASFIAAGIPALMYYRSNDDQWHQPGDTIDRIKPEYVEQAARMGIAMLNALNAGA